jgi:two-component system OmpR family response regulator
MKTKAIIPSLLPIGDVALSKMIKPHIQQTSLLKSSKKGKVLSNKKIITIFLVDDDLLFLKALELSISSIFPSVIIKTFQTGEACLQQMKLKPSVVILDYYLNSEIPYAWNGISILKQIKKINPKTKVVILSSQDSLNIAIDCIENGAYDYISKSESSLVRINNILTNILGDADSNFEGIKFLVIIILFILLFVLFLINH